MRAGWVLLALIAAACGDNLSLSRTHDLVIVAHQDDDLLFMQPDLWNVVHERKPATVVYVTAGDGGLGVGRADGRIMAAKAAYGWTGGSQ
ncbi:MAG TPA: PIG-L family deacetylase, partial [Kofleriaceae bacterium]|nr:PIG-L family deacetylase [Kofleriaceae bacterium]